jgi:hypothetical protein
MRRSTMAVGFHLGARIHRSRAVCAGSRKLVAGGCVNPAGMAVCFCCGEPVHATRCAPRTARLGRHWGQS